MIDALPPDPMAIVIRDTTGWRDDLVWGVSAVAYWKEHGYHVVIDGTCGSVCTLVLGMPPDRVCVTPKAVLEFHAGSDSLARDVQWASYPAAIRNRLGALGDVVVTLRVDELSRLGVRRCPESRLQQLERMVR